MNTKLNLADYLLAAKDADRVALQLLEGRYTYGDLESASYRIARFLVGSGGKKGERALLLSDNSFFWVAAYLGIVRSGMVCVPLPRDIMRQDLLYIRESTEAGVAFVQLRLAAKHEGVLSSVLLVTDKDAGMGAVGKARTSMEAILAAQFIPNVILPETTATDLAALMFTSGTTGKPRGVMVSHGNIVANTNSIIETLGLKADDSIMTVLPFHYCFGTSLLHTHLKVGGSLVIDSRFMYPEIVLQRMAETQCTGFAGVPSHYQILLRGSGLKRRFPHLRYLQQAGGHLAPVFVKQLREALPGVDIFIMYGQTEATARIACLPPDAIERKPGSIGKSIPGVTVRVLDESGHHAAPGEIGEIVVTGECVTHGYWRAPEESALSFREGKLYTGDLATVDEQGFIFLVDRAKEFVKCGGKRVSCRQLEDQLLEFDGLLEVAVVGVPDDILGEAVLAFIVPRCVQHMGLEERLRQFCKSRIPNQVIPRDFVILQSLPKNDAGKVLRQELKGALRYPFKSDLDGLQAAPSVNSV